MSSDSDSDIERLQTHTPRSVARDVASKRRRMHSSSMTASQRAMKARNQDFYSEKGKLFCKFCCKIVDHSRQSSLDKHRQTESHIANKRQPQRQKSITTAFLIPNEARLENVKLITDWVKMCAGANIPFVATDNSTVRNFFKEHVVSGGAIPKSH